MFIRNNLNAQLPVEKGGLADDGNVGFTVVVVVVDTVVVGLSVVGGDGLCVEGGGVPWLGFGVEPGAGKR